MPTPPSRRLRRCALVALWTFVALGAVARSGAAQSRPPGSGAHTFELARVAGDALLIVRNAWSARSATGAAGRTSVVTVSLERPGAPPTAPFEVYRGQPVLAAVAARQGSAVLALFNGGAGAFVQVVTLDLAQPATTGAFPLRRRQVPRGVNNGFAPAQAVAAADSDGFTVLWQEHSLRAGPGARAEAQTWMARVAAGASADGADWIESPRVVEVPWSLAGLGWNGDRYLLALNFDGARPDQTRLCLVELARDGRPQQHPWWASAPQQVTDVQIAPDGGNNLAVFFRGGPNALALRAVAHTTVGNWGIEPPPARELGPIAADAAYAMGIGPDGRAIVVRRSGRR